MEPTAWYGLTVVEALAQLKTSLHGLTAAEAAARRVHYGTNEIVRRKPVSLLHLLVKQFVNFFVLILLFAASLAYVVSFLPGEHGRRLTAFFILGITVSGEG
jgi:magnesium-transporting ATPase (P-type)